MGSNNDNDSQGHGRSMINELHQGRGHTPEAQPLEGLGWGGSLGREDHR